MFLPFTNQGSVRVDSKAQLAYPGGYLLAEMGGGGGVTTLNYTILHYTFGFFCVWCNSV